MKKHLFFCLVLAVLAVGLVLAAETVVLKVKVQAANVRTEPNTNSTIIRAVPLGTLLESDQKSGDWYRIAIDDGKGNQVTGWIYAKIVDVVGGGEAEQPQPERPKAEPEPEREPATAPVTYRQPASYATPKVYSGGGIRLLGGLTSSSISYDQARLDELQGEQDFAQYLKSRPGLYGGVGFEFGSRLSLEFDVMYMPKGAKFEGDFDTPEGHTYSFSANLVANQLSVPVLVKFKILPGSTPYVFAGGEAGYVLSSKLSWSYSGNGQSDKGEQDLLKTTDGEASNLNRFDYGLIFGAGYELALSGLKLTIEGRYHMGMSNMFKDNTSSETMGLTDKDYIHSKALVVLAGIKF
jgi:opacity protein-like surface antigen